MIGTTSTETAVPGKDVPKPEIGDIRGEPETTVLERIAAIVDKSKQETSNFTTQAPVRKKNKNPGKTQRRASEKRKAAEMSDKLPSAETSEASSSEGPLFSYAANRSDLDEIAAEKDLQAVGNQKRIKLLKPRHRNVRRNVEISAAIQNTHEPQTSETSAQLPPNLEYGEKGHKKDQRVKWEGEKQEDTEGTLMQSVGAEVLKNGGTEKNDAAEKNGEGDIKREWEGSVRSAHTRESEEDAQAYERWLDSFFEGSDDECR